MAGAHLGDHIGVVGINAGVVKADGGGLDWAAVQLDGTKVEGDARVGRSVLQRVEPRAVAGLVKDIVALNRALQYQARLAPVQQQPPVTCQATYSASVTAPLCPPYVPVH